MFSFESIEDLSKELKNKLNSTVTKKNIIALYAFNTTGKTRVSNSIASEDDETFRVLRYNTFLEDMFTWDNENFVMKIEPSSWIARLIVQEGLEKSITDNFRSILQSKVEPSFDLEVGEIKFRIASGDNDSAESIKISKGEESVFIWSIFNTVMEIAIETLNEDIDNRTTDVFNDLEYVIIDDPVSSIDDTKIITLAIKLVETIDSYRDANIKFLITTHHALFFNVVVNSFKNISKQNGSNCKFESLKLQRDNQIYILEKQGDAPFAYHLFIKDLIQKAIDDNTIEKYHFNLFRNILEKTANFLGYNNFYDCVVGDKKAEFTRLLHLYSHSRISDLETKDLSSDDKIIFKESFRDFLQHFNWNIKHE